MKTELNYISEGTDKRDKNLFLLIIIFILFFSFFGCAFLLSGEATILRNDIQIVDDNLKTHEIFNQSENLTLISQEPVEETIEEPYEEPWGESNDPYTDSPEIFFHVIEQLTTDVTVTIPDGVTLTIPEVPMGESATWEDVYISNDGTVYFQGEEYPYLYYEGRFRYPESSYGWLVHNFDGELFLQGNAVDQDGILEFLNTEFTKSGLLENEAEVIIKRILDLNMLEFSKPYLAIRYIPMEDVDKTMSLETSEPFSIMRRHFWIEELDEPNKLNEPIFEEINYAKLIIHETAINSE